MTKISYTTHMTDIYLDIDGVLVTKSGDPGNCAAEFIEYVLTNYPDTTHWLTTHCNGDVSKPTSPKTS